MISLALTYIKRFLAYGVWYMMGMIVIYPVAYFSIRRFWKGPDRVLDFIVPCALTWVICVTPEFFLGNRFPQWVPLPTLLFPAIVSPLAILAWRRYEEKKEVRSDR